MLAWMKRPSPMKRSLARGYARTARRVRTADVDYEPRVTQKVASYAQTFEQRVREWTTQFDQWDGSTVKRLMGNPAQWAQTLKMIEEKERRLRESYHDLDVTSRKAWRSLRRPLQAARRKVTRSLVRAYGRLA
jgi:hypothetical protein